MPQQNKSLSRWALKILTWLAWALLIWAALHVLLTFLGRVGHPFQLEWSEGSTFLQGLQFSRTGLVYTDPWNSLFIPHLYTPMHSMLLGWLLKICPAELVVGRLLSLGATVICAWFAWAGARRCGAGKGAAMLAPLALFAFAPGLAWWYDLVRVDMVFLLFFAGAVHFHLKAVTGGRYYCMPLSALMLILAFLCKQTALAYGPIFFIGLFWLRGWRFAGHWGLVASLLLVVSILGMQEWTGGWFWFYAFEVLGRHPYLGFADKWRDLGATILPLLPALIPVFFPITRGDDSPAERGRRFFFLLSLWGLPFAAYAFLKHGGFTNAFLPLLTTALPLLAALPGKRRLLALAGTTATIVWLFAPTMGRGDFLRDPGQMPLPGDAPALAKVVEQMQTTGGMVWCPDNVWLSYKATGDILPLLHLIGELMEEEKFPVPLARYIQARDFSAIMFSGTFDPAFAGRTSLDLLAGVPKYAECFRLIMAHYDPARKQEIKWPSPLVGYQRLGLFYRPAILVPARKGP